MNTIKKLIADKYKLINVCPDTKRPTLLKWNERDYDNLLGTHDMLSSSWALFMGEHPNGRKLFCLDFDVNSSKGKCEKTSDRFNNYIDDCGDDGVFMGSTLENGAVIIDYTDNIGICAMITELCSRMNGNSFKTGLDNMEVFMGDKSIQILPPTRTKCKVSGKLDRARKWLNDVPIAVLENDTPDTSCQIKYFADMFDELLQKHKKKTTAQDQPALDDETSTDGDKWVKLIMDYLGNPRKASGDHLIERADFLKIGACLKSNKYSIDVWKRFVALDARNGDGEKTWDSLTHPVHRNVLRSICKKYKPDALRKWNEDYKMFLSLETVEKGANDIAIWATPHLSDTMRCYEKVWWVFNERKGLWGMTDNVIAKIVSYVQQSIDESVAFHATLKASAEDEDIKTAQQKIMNDFLWARKMLATPSYYNALEKFLRTWLKVDDEWLKKLDNSPYTIAYKNGILDLKVLKFREGLVNSDYRTHTLPFNYEKAKKEDKDWIEEEMKKICNYNPKHLERYLAQYGYAFCGDASKIQEFYQFKGETASNGKSIVLEVLSLIAPNYVKKLDSNTFEKSMKSTFHKHVATWRGKRILWLNETDESARQDEGNLKNLRDGTQMSYNVMYGVNAMMPIEAKLFLVGNNGINVKGDKGIMRSMVINQFDSNFDADNGIEKGKDDYERRMFCSDSKFGDKLFEKKHAFLELIFEYSKKFVDTGKLPPLPREWRDEKEEIRDNLCKFDKWLVENFKWVKTETDKDTESVEDWNVSKYEIDEMLAEAKGFKISNINTEFKRMKLWKTPIQYDSQNWLRGHKGFFTHIKPLTYEEKHGNENE